MAIVNTQKLERYASIPDEERRLAERVLLETDDDTIAEFTAHFRDARYVKKDVPTSTSTSASPTTSWKGPRRAWSRTSN